MQYFSGTFNLHNLRPKSDHGSSTVLVVLCLDDEDLVIKRNELLLVYRDSFLESITPAFYRYWQLIASLSL